MKGNGDTPTAYLQDRPLLTPMQSRILGAAAPLLIACAATWIASARHVAPIEDVTIDWRFRARGPRRPPDNVVIVEIDEKSRAALSRDGRRFDVRKHLATAIDRLADAGALVIGLDVWLDGLAWPEVDGPLSEAIATADVVLAVAYTGGYLKRAPPIFRAAQPAEGVISVDAGRGVLRRFPKRLYLDVVDDSEGGPELVTIPHFPLVIALYAALQEDESARIELGEGTAQMGRFTVHAGELVDFAAVPSLERGDTSPWKTVSLADVVRGRFDDATIRDAIVLIGEAGLARDSFVMPLADGLAPGVYYHANAVAHIVEDRHYDAAWSTGLRAVLLTGVLSLAAGLFAWNQRPWWRRRHSTPLLTAYILCGIVIFLGGWTAAAFVTFNRNVLLPLAGPLAGMSLALAAGLAGQWVILSANSRRLAERSRRIENLFGQSVSRHVLAALKQQPERIARTEVREVSVLFCDLRNFTAQTSTMDPADVASMLNEYFNYITSAVFEHDGFIDKFVGDEIMAVFSVPFEQPDHAVRAVRTAIAIKRRLADLNRARAERGLSPLQCGLGIHRGPAAAGHIGSRERSNYTVVGNTVNLAARIEHFTTGGEILVSDAVRRSLPPDIRLHPWKQVEIRGAPGRHDLFEVETEDD